MAAWISSCGVWAACHAARICADDNAGGAGELGISAVSASTRPVRSPRARQSQGQAVARSVEDSRRVHARRARAAQARGEASAAFADALVGGLRATRG